MWANECCGTITGAANPGQWAHIPPELDYISYPPQTSSPCHFAIDQRSFWRARYDCYSVPTHGWMTPNEPQGHWNGTAEPTMARKAYQSWYHMLHPHQKVMVLPGLFGWNTSIVSEEVQVRAS